jgi:hypothetical protein
MTYGASRDEAVANAETLALRVLADRVEHGEAVSCDRQASRFSFTSDKS